MDQSIRPAYEKIKEKGRMNKRKENVLGRYSS